MPVPLEVFLISIHALRVEGDFSRGEIARRLAEFQSTPSVWRATPLHAHRRISHSFQSTPSVWRATPRSGLRSSPPIFQSTPSVWRATASSGRGSRTGSISIHALRVEGDLAGYLDGFTIPISIHALRVEGDPRSGGCDRLGVDFNPRPPCGGRPAHGSHCLISVPISIHALRVEGDPHGDVSCHSSVTISIHALRVEGDTAIRGRRQLARISIHALRVEGDVMASLRRSSSATFQSTPSVWRAT